MELILWRHAEAEDGYPDDKRELTKRGRKQATRVGRWLRERVPADSVILVSPAMRTRQTADALRLPYEISKQVGTGASPEDILAAAAWPEGKRTVVVVGHQPTLGSAAAQLLGADGVSWSVKKGALWWFSGQVDQPDSIVVRAVLGPDLA